MILIIGIVSIVISLTFASLGLMDILNEGNCIKKQKIEAFVLLLRYLFIYPFIKLPFIINENRDLFNIKDIDDKGQKKSRNEILIEILLTWRHILRQITSNYSVYVNDMAVLVRKSVKKRQFTKATYREKQAFTPRNSTQSMLDIFLEKFISCIVGENQNCNYMYRVKQ